MIPARYVPGATCPSGRTWASSTRAPRPRRAVGPARGPAVLAVALRAPGASGRHSDADAPGRRRSPPRPDGRPHHPARAGAVDGAGVVEPVAVGGYVLARGVDARGAPVQEQRGARRAGQGGVDGAANVFSLPVEAAEVSPALEYRRCRPRRRRHESSRIPSS